jgi:hypothetical protein
MASYMPQSTSGGDCCDCPERESPCDDCGGGACCKGTWPVLVCSVESEADCISDGGHFLGNGTTCVDIDCNSGACCRVNGSCGQEPDFTCTDPEIFKGYGTKCATSRCEGACIPCRTCPTDCFCVQDVTYQECNDAYLDGCTSVAWFLAETCLTKDCDSAWPPFGCNQDIGACCDTFGDPGCSDNLTEADCTAFGGSSWNQGCTCDDLSCWDGCDV